MRVMEAAEFRGLREYLGLTGAVLASYLGVNDRTVRRWEEDGTPIPAKAAEGLEVLAALADVEARDLRVEVTRAYKALNPVNRPEVEVVISTYRTDGAYYASRGDKAFLSAGWHRMICTRVARETPGVRVVFYEDIEP